jgi:hypothetical protein
MGVDNLAVCQARPTEFVPALHASHVVASFPFGTHVHFLVRRTALWAWLQAELAHHRPVLDVRILLSLQTLLF